MTKTITEFSRIGTWTLLLGVLFLQSIIRLGEGGVVIENHSNDTAVTIAVYDGGLDMVLEIGLLDAGSGIEWDDKTVSTNFSNPWKYAPPVPAEHLFVIKNSQDNATVTSQYFFDGTSVSVLDDSIGGLSIKVTGTS